MKYWIQILREGAARSIAVGASIVIFQRAGAFGN